MSGWRRCAYGFQAPLRRSLTATSAPTWSGRPGAADVRRGCAGRSIRRRPRRPACMNGGLMDSAHIALDSDCFSNATASTRPVDAGPDQAGRDDRGRPADRAGRVHPQQRLAGRAERVGQEQLRHHHALEQVRGLAEHHRVDVGEGRCRRRPAPGRPPPGTDRPSTRRYAGCGAGSGPVPRTAARCPAHRASITQTRFCCRAGPLVACAERPVGPAGDDLPRRPRRSGRARPRTSGCRTSAPPDGLTRTSSPSPSARRSSSSWWVNGACSSATSTPRATPAARAAAVADGDRGQVAYAQRRRSRSGGRSR